MSRALQCNYEESCANFIDFTKIIVIDTARKEIQSVISMPWPYTPIAAVVPSPDGKWRYFSAADFTSSRLGIGKLNLESQEVVDFLPNQLRCLDL